MLGIVIFTSGIETSRALSHCKKKKCEGHLLSPAVRLKSIDGHTIFYHWGEITPTRERFYWCEVIRVTSLRYSCDLHSAIRVTSVRYSRSCVHDLIHTAYHLPNSTYTTTSYGIKFGPD